MNLRWKLLPVACMLGLSGYVFAQDSGFGLLLAAIAALTGGIITTDADTAFIPQGWRASNGQLDTLSYAELEGAANPEGKIMPLYVSTVAGFIQPLETAFVAHIQGQRSLVLEAGAWETDGQK